MSSITNVSRRGFLKGLAGAGALVLGAYYVPKVLRHDEAASGRTDVDRATLHPNAFVGIDTDGTVYIVAHRSEMGTVIRTTLPMVVAAVAGSEAYCQLNSTSSAVNGWPSCHFTPCLSFQVTDLPSLARPLFSRSGISAARTGSRYPSGSQLASGS